MLGAFGQVDLLWLDETSWSEMPQEKNNMKILYENRACKGTQFIRFHHPWMWVYDLSVFFPVLRNIYIYLLKCIPGSSK